MEKTPLNWIRAQIEIGKVELADVTMLCDRIEELERYCAGLEEENDLLSTSLDGHYTVFLNPEDRQRVAELYAMDKLAYEQEEDPGMEFEEAFEYFVSGAVDLAWDLARYERGELELKPPKPPTVKQIRTRAKKRKE